MKYWLILVGCAAVAGLWYVQGRLTLSPAAPAAELAPPKTVYGVEEFMKRTGTDRVAEVVVEGVISASAPDHQLLALIDREEFQRCKLTNCAALTLPVRWTGAMPRVEETVRVMGTIQETHGKLLFVAQRLEKVDIQATATP
ncbi:MAG: hypothetical protein HYW07_00810 [Candidatus Latescibacteria bacterium]|nr:hypothetical protein [Candidatus Latescibacterota bacterium]